MDFSGKNVLVTGATRGIGRAAAEAYLKGGARVAINGRSAGSVEAVLGELSAGRMAVAAPGDLSRVDECQRVVDAAVNALGGLDILVNNAGLGGDRKAIIDTTVQDWDNTMNLNLRAVFFCIKAAVPPLKAAKGNIVNVASVLGLGGRGLGLSLYCTSKGGVVNLTRDAAIELAPEIRVNCICPGSIDTDMLRELGRSLGRGDVEAGYALITQGRPMKRVANPAEIANAILYLSSDLASFVTGSIHTVDGGVMAKAG